MNEWEGQRGQGGYARESLGREQFGRGREEWQGSRGFNQGYGQGYGQNFGQGYGGYGRGMNQWEGQQGQSFGRGEYGGEFGRGEYGRGMNDWQGNRDYVQGYGGSAGRDDWSSGRRQEFGRGGMSDWQGNRGRGQEQSFGQGSGQGYGQGYSGSGRRMDEWGGGSMRGNQGRFHGIGPKGYQRSDERIREEINEQMMWHGDLDASNIEVQVSNGVVTLTGTVDNRWDKRMAEDLAEQMRGVHDVHNQIQVRRQNEMSQQGNQSGMSQQGSQGSQSSGTQSSGTQTSQSTSRSRNAQATTSS